MLQRSATHPPSRPGLSVGTEETGSRPVHTSAASGGHHLVARGKLQAPENEALKAEVHLEVAAAAADAVWQFVPGW